MKRKKTTSNRAGFTLIEIIAVLIVLGVLAAVAVPKYVGVTEEARNAAAKGAIAEAKGRLSMAYGKEVLKAGSTNVTVETVRTAAGAATSGATIDMGDDFAVTLTDGTGLVTITVSSVQGTALDTAVTDTWTMPTP